MILLIFFKICDKLYLYFLEDGYNMSNNDIEKIFQDVTNRFNFIDKIDKKISEYPDKREIFNNIEPSYCFCCKPKNM
jgi:hypothetical protein